MKLLIITLLAFGIFTTIKAITPEQAAKSEQFKEACIVQENVTKEAVDKAFGTKQDYGKVDKNLKCYANCFLHKAKFLIDGVVQEDILRAVLGPSKGDKIDDYMKQCNKLKGSDVCETAFMLLNCYHKEHADIMI